MQHKIELQITVWLLHIWLHRNKGLLLLSMSYKLRCLFMGLSVPKPLLFLYLLDKLAMTMSCANLEFVHAPSTESNCFKTTMKVVASLLTAAVEYVERQSTVREQCRSAV